MRVVAIPILIFFFSYLSCDKIIAPEDSIDPNGIFFSVAGNVYKMNYDGSNKVQLTFDEEDNNNPFISNDGKYLIYETQSHSEGPPFDSYLYNLSVVNIMDLDTREIIDIDGEDGWASSPALSPDNQFVVFITAEHGSGGAIVITDFNGTSYNRLTEYGLNIAPIITLQGDKIIWVSEENQNRNIYIMDLDGNNKQQLTDTQWNINPVLSPDGCRIIWESYRDIYAMNLDGSDKINISNNDMIFSRTPSYSHAGDRVVFITERTYNVPIEQSIREIHLIDLNTKERKIILKPGANFAPIYFPNDTKIIFSQYENSQFYICTIKSDGSDLNRLGRGGNPCIY